MKPYLFSTTTHRDIEHGAEYAELKACSVGDWKMAYQHYKSSADYLDETIRFLRSVLDDKQPNAVVEESLSRLLWVEAQLRYNLTRCEERLLDLRLYDGDLKGLPKQFPTGIKTEGNGRVDYLEAKFPRAEE